jgi:hypothetical protein
MRRDEYIRESRFGTTLSTVLALSQTNLQRDEFSTAHAVLSRPLNCNLLHITLPHISTTAANALILQA